MSVGARFADYDEVEAARRATALRPEAAASTSSKLGGDPLRDDDVSAAKKFLAPTPAGAEPGGDGRVRGRGRDRGRGHDRGSGGGGRGLSSEAGTRGPPAAPGVGGAASAGGTSASGVGGIFRGHGRCAAMVGGRGVGGRGVGGRGGKTAGGRGVGGLCSASSEVDAEPPRVPTTEAEWEKLNTAQHKYFATWQPIAGGGDTQFLKALALMTKLGNVRGSHVEAANVAIADIHRKYHPVVFPSALSSYSIPSATGAPDAAAGAPPPAPPPVRGAYSHVRFWKVRGGEHAGMYGASRRVGRLDGDRFGTVSLSATGHSGWARPF